MVANFNKYIIVWKLAALHVQIGTEHCPDDL